MYQCEYHGEVTIHDCNVRSNGGKCVDYCGKQEMEMRRQRAFQRVINPGLTQNIIPTELVPTEQTWAVGVTTVPERRHTYLPRTLASLDAAGFDKPRLFIDGAKDHDSWEKEFGVQVTCRWPKIRTYGNWVLALAELYIRQPHATRYVMFQDDVECSRNLRKYLEHCKYPEKGYWNLYTFPHNQQLCPQGHTGWYSSNQDGKGALGLVFSREIVLLLLTHQHMVDRPMSKETKVGSRIIPRARDGTQPTRGQVFVDGGVVQTAIKMGWQEYVHNPCLVEHIGDVSELGHGFGRVSKSYRGSHFDCLTLIGS